MYAGRRCYHVDELENVLREFEVRMALLATRPEGLQGIVDRIGGSGVRAILNFVPKLVKAPAGCFIEHTDITARLELLSFLVGSAGLTPGRRTSRWAARRTWWYDRHGGRRRRVFFSAQL